MGFEAALKDVVRMTVIVVRSSHREMCQMALVRLAWASLLATLALAIQGRSALRWCVCVRACVRACVCVCVCVCAARAFSMRNLNLFHLFPLFLPYTLPLQLTPTDMFKLHGNVFVKTWLFRYGLNSELSD